VAEIYEKRCAASPARPEGRSLTARHAEEFSALLRQRSRSLDRKLYELIYIRVSLINGCHYCTQHHVASSKRVGLTVDDWRP